MHNDTIARREETYRHSLEETPIETEIDLF